MEIVDDVELLHVLNDCRCFKEFIRFYIFVIKTYKTQNIFTINVQHNYPMINKKIIYVIENFLHITRITQHCQIKPKLVDKELMQTTDFENINILMS